MKKEQLHELLFQALETEVGGVQVYETALNVRSMTTSKGNGRSISIKPVHMKNSYAIY